MLAPSDIGRMSRESVSPGLAFGIIACILAAIAGVISALIFFAPTPSINAPGPVPDDTFASATQ